MTTTPRAETDAHPARKPPARKPQTAYLVLGMHRSGTSAVTQVLALAGCRLPANVMPGDEHNARGYFEPWKVAVFNDERLRAGGSAWDDPFAYPYRPLSDPAAEADWRKRAAALFRAEFGQAAFPLMKDPRVTALGPLWRGALDDLGVAARVVIPVRHPLAVAGSLARRDGFPAARSVLVWCAYMLAAEAYSRGLPRAFVGYDALLADWRGEVARIEAAHGAPLPALTPAAAARIDAFLAPELRHNAGDGGLEALGWAGALAAQVYGWCAAKAAGDEPPIAVLEDAAVKLAARQAEIGMLVSPAARDLAAARADLAEAERRLAAAQTLERELREEMARRDAAARTLERELREEMQRRDDAAQALADDLRAEMQRRQEVTEALEAELRAEAEAQRTTLEAGWRAADRRLQQANAALARINLELDAALSDG